MRYSKYKLFFNYEKEERWLNEMAARGFQCVGVSVPKYDFVVGKEGEYRYRIELLEHKPHDPVGQKYIGFLEETGIEHIGQYRNWAYFRRRASEGEFDIYSDADSRIRHLTRIRKFYIRLAFVEAGCALVTLLSGSLNAIQLKSYADTAPTLLCVCLTVFVISMIVRLSRRIKKLKRERLLRE